MRQREYTISALFLAAVSVLLATVAASCGGTGHATEGTPADKRQVETLLKHYYKFGAATGDGDEACEMMASSLRSVVVKRYGKGSDGPSYLRAGTTCQGVANLLFTHFEQRIAREWAHVEVVALRLHGERGVAIVRFGGTPERQIAILREGKAWKVDSLLDEKVS